VTPYNTGRVAIGSKYAPPQRWADTTASEDRLQAALLRDRRQHPRTWSRWALFGPLLFAVMALALLNVVKSRHEERQRITAACLEVQDVERGNPAACRYLFTGER
jgi:hypothetical protein